MATYYALLEDNRTVLKQTNLNNLTGLNQPIKYLFEEALDESIRTYNGWTKELFKYTSIDLNGIPKAIVLEDFTITDIGRDDKNDTGTNRTLFIVERRTNNSRSIKTYTHEWDFKRFLMETLPLLCNDLNSVGSFKAYDLLQRNKELEDENKQLKLELAQLKGTK